MKVLCATLLGVASAVTGIVDGQSCILDADTCADKSCCGIALYELEEPVLDAPLTNT